MTSDPILDRSLTHSITNYLLAALQGRIAGLNVLGQLKHQDFNAEQLEATKSEARTVNRWTSELWQGSYLLLRSWNAPETTDAIHAFKILEALKFELAALSAQLNQILGAPALDQRFEDLKVLFAAFARYSYAREHYIKGFVEYAKRFNITDVGQEYEAILPPATAEVKIVHQLLKGLKANEFNDPNLNAEIINRSILLPGVFATHCHDISQLLHIYKTDFSYAAAGVGPEEAQTWQRQEMNPSFAGYWKAWGLSAEEALQWCGAGITSPGLVFEWSRLGFLPEHALPWLQQSFPSPIARRWYKAGYTPEEAISWLQKGVQDPSQVPEENNE